MMMMTRCVRVAIPTLIVLVKPLPLISPVLLFSRYAAAEILGKSRDANIYLLNTEYLIELLTHLDIENPTFMLFVECA